MKKLESTCPHCGTVQLLTEDHECLLKYNQLSARCAKCRVWFICGHVIDTVKKQELNQQYYKAQHE